MNAAIREPRRKIRPMREPDLDGVLNIEHAVYDFPWSYGTFRDCLRVGYACWVVEIDAEIAGYGILSAAGGEAHVLNLCVHPHHQSQGVGRGMLQRLIDLARWHRADRIFLEVRPSNAPAKRLYRGMGFQEVGRRRNYYPARDGREDALVMAHELERPRA